MLVINFVGLASLVLRQVFLSRLLAIERWMDSARSKEKEMRRHPMASYRLYTLSSKDRVCEGFDLEAESDSEAVHLARLRLEHRNIELWRGTRKIASVPKDGLPKFMAGSR